MHEGNEKSKQTAPLNAPHTTVPSMYLLGVRIRPPPYVLGRWVAESEAANRSVDAVDGVAKSVCREGRVCMWSLRRVKLYVHHIGEFFIKG